MKLWQLWYEHNCQCEYIYEKMSWIVFCVEACQHESIFQLRVCLIKLEKKNEL